MKSMVRIALGVLMVGAASPALALDRPAMDALRAKAVAAIEAKGVKDGVAFLGDPANGFLDLKGPGLHSWGVLRKGLIAFDHSGQTQPDMDISTLTTMDGQSVTAKTFSFADKEGGGGYDEKSWPHPVTGAMGNSYISCGVPKINKDLAVCVMAWIN